MTSREGARRLMHSVNTAGDVPDAESDAVAGGTNALLQRSLRPPTVMSPRVVARTTSRYQEQAGGGKVLSGFASLCLEPAPIPCA
mmetsp:Transcript_14999/g.35309  ORF Transcript_14999/g.35309 Transcript_14999/m.35309 type:complete len:85 (-) Transcript_14999:510-764(-)